jgi:hypothetical protein
MFSKNERTLVYFREKCLFIIILAILKGILINKLLSTEQIYLLTFSYLSSIAGYNKP